jgi:hypothetical protein
MLDLSQLSKVKYVIDSQGKKAAVQVDMELWGEILNYLEDLEDREIIKSKLQRLRRGPEQAGAVSWDDASEEW